MRPLVALAVLLLAAGCSRSIEGTATGVPTTAPASSSSTPVAQTTPAPDPGEPDTPDAAAVALEQMYDAVALGDFAGACTRISPVGLGWTPQTCTAEVAANVANVSYDLSTLTVDRARVQAEPDLVRIPGSALRIDGLDSPSAATYEMRRTDGIWRLSGISG